MNAKLTLPLPSEDTALEKGREFLSSTRKKPQQAPEVVLTIAVKSISNYTNHLFDTPVDAAFTSHALTVGTK
jgi:hypothetical protein